MVKKLLYALAGIVGVFLVVALFLPGSYSVERSIEINKPPDVVFAQIADYHAWLQWSPWPQMEPSAKQTVIGTPGEAGMTWSWEGKEIGVGSMTLVAVEKDRSIHSKLAFRAPMESQADDYVTLSPTAGGTQVTWRNTGDVPYPVGRYFGLGIEGMLGPQFEEGLANLKRICEKIEDPEAGPGEESTADQTQKEDAII